MVSYQYLGMEASLLHNVGQLIEEERSWFGGLSGTSSNQVQ